MRRPFIAEAPTSSLTMQCCVAAIAALLAAAPTWAQVHKCTDVTGKTTFSDTPCPTNAKSANQVLGRNATEKADEPEDAGYRRNMESINRSRAALAPPWQAQSTW